MSIRLFPLVFLVACTSVDGGLEVTGFDTHLPSTGLWIVETLVWAPDHPQAGEPEPVLHSFVLASDGLDCAYLAATWDGGPAQIAYDEARFAGVVGEELCELERAMYVEQAESPFQRPGLAIQLQLWNTQVDEDHIGVEPGAETYTALDGPDEDVIEYASLVTWGTENWAARVAQTLDCSAADPSSTVDWESTTESFDAEGPITFAPGAERVGASLALEIIEQEARSTVGTVDGDASFERCEVERVLQAPIPAG